MAYAAAPSISAAAVSPAADAPPMRVTIVRGAYDGCEPACAEWVSAEGKIDKRTLGQFRAALKALGARKAPILIHSGGGDVDEAMAVGRLIRAKGLDVAVARTEFSAPADSSHSAPAPAARKSAKGPPPARGYARSPRAVCASACTLILAAGNHRYAGLGALVGVHDIVIPEQTVTQKVRYYQIRTLRKGDKIVSREKILVEEKNVPRHIARSKPSAGLYRRVRDYLIEMGASRDVVDLMKTAPPEGIRWLTKTELASTRLSTEDRGGETLVAFTPSVATPPPRTAAAVEDSPAIALSPPAGPQARATARRFGRDMILPMAVLAFGLLWLVGSFFVKLRGASTKPRLQPSFGPEAPKQ